MTTPKFLNASLGSLLLLRSCLFLSSRIRLQLFLPLPAASYHSASLCAPESVTDRHGGSCHGGQATTPRTQPRGANTPLPRQETCMCCMPSWRGKENKRASHFLQTHNPLIPWVSAVSGPSTFRSAQQMRKQSHQKGL